LKRVFFVSGIIVLVIAVAGAVGGYFYWRHLKSTPQYSLALIVEAARVGDQAALDSLVDSDAVVDDFVPQITDKAVELYGRGLPPEIVARVAAAAEPVMPILKSRVRAELPRLIRRETERFREVPFAAMVFAAERYLEIDKNGTEAIVRSRLPQHGFEVRMRQNGERWQIVAVQDSALAEQIAKAIGEQIIAVASREGLKKTGEKLGIPGLKELIRQAEDLLR
jgi:hypothetical protein